MEISQERINKIDNLHSILKLSPRSLRNKLDLQNPSSQKKRKLDETTAWWKETLYSEENAVVFHSNKRHKTLNLVRKSDDSEEPHEASTPPTSTMNEKEPEKNSSKQQQHRNSAMQSPNIVHLNNLCSNILKSKRALCKASTHINSRSAIILTIINEFILKTKKYILRLFPHQKKRVSDERFHILVSLETELTFISSEYDKTFKKMGSTLREVNLETGKNLVVDPRELEFSCGQVRTMREERCTKLKRLNEKVERSLRGVFDVWRKGDSSRKDGKVDRVEKWVGKKLVMLKNEVAKIEGAVESAE